MAILKKFAFNDVTRFRLFSTIVLAIMSFLALLPIVLIVIGSFSDEKVLISTGYSYFPSKLSLDSYYYMVKQSAMILHAYGITILVTIVGTLVSVLITTMLAYPMSRRDFKYRNFLAFFVFFTMLFIHHVVSIL
jgi:putative aldouronate transport system permease protein